MIAVVVVVADFLFNFIQIESKKKQCKQGGAAAGTGKNSTYKKTERTSSKDRNYTNYKLYFSVMFYTYVCVCVCVCLYGYV